MIPGPGTGTGESIRAASWVVVPAYQEAGVIGGVVAGLRRAGWRVLVVDDGSKDGTAVRAAAAGAVALRHPVNLGQGAALRTGFDFLRDDPTARYVVTFDADGQHDPGDVEALVLPLAQDRADITLGSRFLRADHTLAIPRARRGLLRAATALARWTTGLALTDTHNGLRAIRRETLRRMALRQDRMAHASEIHQEIRRLRLRFLEIPVHVTYSRYSLTKGQRLVGAISILWDLLAAKMR